MSIFQKRIGERKDDLYLIIIVISTLLLYYPILDNFFLLDDTNWLIRAQNFIKKPLSLFYPTEDGHIRPFLVFIFFCVSPVFKLNANYYYLLMIVLHLLNIISLYYIASNLIKNKKIAFISSLIFATSFNHHQAVIWIAAIPHLLSTTCFLLTLLLFLKFINNKNKIPYILSLITYSLGLVTRESVMLTPFILLFLYLLLMNDFKKSILVSLPFIFITLIYFYIHSLFHPISVFTHPLSYIFTKRFIFTIFSCFAEFISNHYGLINIPNLSTKIFNIIGIVNLVIMAWLIIIFIFYILRKRKKVNFINIFIFSLSATILLLIPFCLNPAITKFGMFHRYRYFYLPATTFVLMFGALLYLIYDYLKEINKLLLNIICGNLILSIIIINSFAVRKVESIHYDYYSKVSYQTITKIRNICNRCNDCQYLYLLNFPKSPFLVFGGIQHLDNLTKLYCSDKWQVRTTITQFDKKEFKKAIFLEFKEGKIVDRTKFYQSILH